MKTVQGFRHKGNFVVASPHAGFSNVANNAAHSIFLIIPSPRHQLHSIESVAPAGSVCICRFCQWCRPDPVFHAAAADFGFPFLRSIGWVAASSTPRGRAELVRRTSQRNVAMQVSNAFYHWPVHACVLCPQENGRRLWRLRQRNDRSQFFYYDVWRTELGLLGARSKRLVFLE